MRVTVGVGIAVVLACLAWALGGRTDPVLEGAAARLGDRWYRLMLDDHHVGFLHTQTRRDALGRWHFGSDLRFVLTSGNPVRIEERLLFDATPPYPLLAASQRSERPGDSDGTYIEQRQGRYHARRIDSDASSAELAAQPLELTFSLGDYLGLETWLRTSDPQPGSTVAAASIDFARRQVLPREFRVIEKNATGFQLEHAAPLDQSRIQLDRRMRPVYMTLSGLFELQHVSKQQALAPRTALQAASYFVPIDRPLPDHTRIEALELLVHGGASAAELWPELAHGSAVRHRANAVTNRPPSGDELMETADHPISDPRIRALAVQAVAGVSDDRERVAALTEFVHGYLRYQDEPGRRHVLTLLEEPVGSCTEFADLLTTLARALEIPSRTVFGLAYADERPPAFRFHAWNELLVDGEWLAVDPTWNQLRIDATHIPMPANVARSLQLLTGGLGISFEVGSVQYAP
ncbi:MAG: transglutaminase-like domain-containing protein [Pseudomonadales bacterium]